jgi:hypothetical protein
MAKDNNYFNKLYNGIKNSIRYDSLKLRIPIHLVDIKDKSILDYYAETNLNTGELSPSIFKQKSKEYFFNQTSKVKILIEKRPTAKGKIEECLIILLNSKILRGKYLEGLHFDIMQSVYNDLMSLNVFYVDFDTFMRSDCTDVDLKLDEVMNQEEWTALINQFMQLTKQTKEQNKGYKRFKPNAQYPYQNGLMYNTRATASASTPFLKLYWKGGELITQSLDFYEENLQSISRTDILKLVRIETTIKDKRHAKSLDINDMTLLGLLSLTEQTKENVFRKMIAKHLERPQRTLIAEAPKSIMTPEQLIQYYSIVLLMEHTKYNADEVIKSLLQGITSAPTKSRKKKELTMIYDKHIRGNKIDLRTEKINSFFSKFDWN